MLLRIFEFGEETVMLLVRNLFIDTSLSKLVDRFTELSIGLGDKRGLSLGVLIRPKCITILYHNLSLFIDIFHVMMMFLCCFGLFYTVCNFPMPKQQTQDSAGKSGC